jgi:hypothetical protein
MLKTHWNSCSGILVLSLIEINRYSPFH